MTTSPRIIKKYPNRRLYDTETSTYITLAEVKQLVMQQHEFRVVDTKTNEDITREILLQIILEEESAASPMFSSDLLTQMIRSYGDATQNVMGAYLDKSIRSFMEAQQKLQEQFRATYGENPMLSSETWAQFLNAQMPAMQALMGNYLQQSASMFVGLQQQVSEQARTLFGGFGATPNAEAKQEPQQPGSRGKTRKGGQ